MQQQLRDGYLLSTADINAAAGSAIAKYSPVGDAWENAGFPTNFYANDLYHAANRGTLLSALTIYSTIYDDRSVSDINLSGVLTSLGLTAQDGAAITAIVDATVVPEPATCGGMALIGTVVVQSVRRRRRLTAGA